MKLYYEQPAKNWHESLPLGNGRLGAMVYGGTKKEILALNEDTLWSGYPEKTQKKLPKDYIKKSKHLRNKESIKKQWNIWKSVSKHQKMYRCIFHLEIFVWRC